MKPVVQSLWVGNKLSLLEIYSIKSFLKLGYDFHLYTYEYVEGVPIGTTIKDGNQILLEENIFLLKKTLLPFADIFRYRMLYLNGGYWVDLDMIAIKKFTFNEDYIFSSERTMINGAFKMKDPNEPDGIKKYIANIGVLKAPKNSKFYKELYDKCMKYQNKGINKDKLKYMRMLRKQITEYNYEKFIKPPEYFCHLDWWHSKDAFMPVNEFKMKYGVKSKSIESMFQIPYTVHLWRDLVTKKYKLDLNANYDERCFWELIKKMIDN